MIWTEELEAKLMKLVNTYLSKGFKTMEAFKKVSEKLGISTPNGCKAKYYIVLNGLGKDTKKKAKKLHRSNIRDKKKIVKIVSETIKDGEKVAIGLKRASQETGYSYMTCKGQWDSAKNIKKSRVRNSWSKEQDDLLVDIIVAENKKGIAVNNACGIAAKALNRTKASCVSRWAIVLREKNIKNVDLAYNYWTTKEKHKVLRMISQETQKGSTLGEAFEIISNEFDGRSIESIRSLYKKIKKNRLDYDIGIGNWLEEEEDKLKNIILNGTREGKEIDYLFIEAANTINKKLNAVKNRWYSRILPMCKEEYAKIRIAKRGKLVFEPTKRGPRKPWTREEDKILLEIIHKNLKQKRTLGLSYEEASEVLENRSATACLFRYKQMK